MSKHLDLEPVSFTLQFLTIISRFQTVLTWFLSFIFHMISAREGIATHLVWDSIGGDAHVVNFKVFPDAKARVSKVVVGGLN